MKKAALITGGARRIGKAVALALAKRGYDIALHCNRSEDEAVRTAKMVRHEGRACEVFVSDLADNAGLSGLIPAVRQCFPHCRLLVNNASAFERASFAETDPERFDRMMQIHVKAPFFLTQSFASHFGAGHVVNFCDAKVTSAFVSHFAYSLSKKTLFEFTRMAAKALGPSVRVNAVAPGIILPSREFDEAALIRLSRKIPLQRRGDVEDVASAVLFLDENPYITGECIFVDGGENIK
jgi:NAD(P)-dependent dehydrogenase (short-subunit alcohol dehydrogenase family)